MSDEPVVKRPMTLQVAGELLADAYLPTLRASLGELPWIMRDDRPPLLGPPAPEWWERELDALGLDEGMRARVFDLIDRAVEDAEREW